MELISAIKVGSEAISLGAELAKLIKTIRASSPEEPQLEEILQRLQIEAVRLSRDFEHRLRAAKDSLVSMGLNPDLSLEKQFDDLKWYNFSTRARLKSLREECFSIHRQLATFIDDATAVLLCKGRAQAAGPAFKESLRVKNELDGLFTSSHTPLKTIFDEMLRLSNQISAELVAA